MYPSKFEHIPVQSIDDALDALEQYDDAELLAGGQSLVPLQKTRFASPDHVIDITPLDELKYVEENDDDVEIGALATHTEIQQASSVKDHVPVFSECIGQIADWPVRNQGTFGGTVAEADPSGDYLPVMQVMNPDITVRGPDGDRTIPFDEFYIGMFTVDLEEKELLISGRFPKLSAAVPDAEGIGSTYKKHAERSGDYALVGVAAIVAVDENDVVVEARLSIGAVGPLTRASEAESIVEGTTLGDETLADASDAVKGAVLPDEEGYEGEYKREMAGTFAEQSLRTAYDRAITDS